MATLLKSRVFLLFSGLFSILFVGHVLVAKQLNYSEPVVKTKYEVVVLGGNHCEACWWTMGWLKTRADEHPGLISVSSVHKEEGTGNEAQEEWELFRRDISTRFCELRKDHERCKLFAQKGWLVPYPICLLVDAQGHITLRAYTGANECTEGLWNDLFPYSVP